MRDDISLTILGGGAEIGANSYFLHWGETNLLLDCGMNPSRTGYEALPALDLLKEQELDAVIISHAHQDHIGSLPFVFCQYFGLGAKVYATPATVDLLPVVLLESAKIVERRLPWEEQYYYHHYFDRENITGLVERARAVPFYQEFRVNDHLSCFFFPAGHILGSAGVVITDGDYTLVYTGDICKDPQVCVHGYELPDGIRADCLILESTYGADKTAHTRDKDEEYRHLARSIKKTLRNKGHVLLPSFGLGRAQEMGLRLHMMKRDGLIQKKAPIFYHPGLTGSVNPVYENHDRAGPASDLSSVWGELNIYEQFKEPGDCNDVTDKPSIFAFTSGMMSRKSPSALLAERLLQDEKSAVFFTGYLVPHELGYEVLHTRLGGYVCVDMDASKWVQIKTGHIQKFHFSAHADRHQLLDTVGHFAPEIVLWVHGDEEATKWLSRACKSGFSHAPANREKILLRKDGRKINRPLTTYRGVLVTVGDSLLDSYCEATGNSKQVKAGVISQELEDYIIDHAARLPELSIETRSLSKHPLEKDDYLYFMCDKNAGARICAEKLFRLYCQERLGALVFVDDLGLQQEDEQQNACFTNMMDQMVEIIESHNRNTVIHAAGGPRSHIALITLLGTIFQQTVWYLEEGFESFAELSELPIGFDYNLLEMNRGLFFQLLDAREYWKADEVYNNLPRGLQSCFERDYQQERYRLTPLGRAVYASFHGHLSEKVKEIPVEVVDVSPLWGSETDSLSKLINPSISLIVTRIAKFHELIVSFEFFTVERELSESPGPSTENHLQLVSKKEDRLEYAIWHLSMLEGRQDRLYVHTLPGMSSYLVERIGRNIYP